MRYTEKAINVLTALESKGIGLAWINKNFKAIHDVRTLWEMACNDTKNKELSYETFMQKRDNIERQLDNDDSSDGVVVIGDKDFPIIPDFVNKGERPVALFYKGDISLINQVNKNVTVIGLLNPVDGIEERERAFVKALVLGGCTIVSGLAKGCDAISHRQTLDSSGKTIAILPGTLRNIIPAENKLLSEEIVANNGLLVTEYYKEVSSKNELVDRYVKRDRLQAMFSKAICLTASYAPNDKGNDSGSRHAMSKAKEYNIQRYVMYNPKTDAENEQFDLNRDLLKEVSVRVLSTRSIEAICNATGVKTSLFG